MPRVAPGVNRFCNLIERERRRMTMKRSILGVFVALAVAAAGEVCASNTTSKIQEFGLLAETNIGWVKMAGPITSPAGCATQGYYVMNLNTESGRWAFR